MTNEPKPDFAVVSTTPRETVRAPLSSYGPHHIGGEKLLTIRGVSINFGNQYEAGAKIVPEIAARWNLHDDLVGVLEAARAFILDEYQLNASEAGHDGHPMEKAARPIWDAIHDVLATLDAAKPATSEGS